MSTFSRKHIFPTTELAEFRGAREEMLKNTLVLENPSLCERTQILEDQMLAQEIDDRRRQRRTVRQAKRLYLAAAAGF